MSFQWEQCLCSGAEEANVKRVGMMDSEENQATI